MSYSPYNNYLGVCSLFEIQMLTGTQHDKWMWWAVYFVYGLDSNYSKKSFTFILLEVLFYCMVKMLLTCFGDIWREEKET